mgnify:CR=1 FL=1
MKATKIKMKLGCANSTKTTEIDQIYIEGCSNPGYYKKADIYDHLKSHPNSIYVDISPYPDLIPALSSNYEKYVRSEPNDTPSDNLLKLPRHGSSQRQRLHGLEIHDFAIRRDCARYILKHKRLPPALTSSGQLLLPKYPATALCLFPAVTTAALYRLQTLRR